MNRKISEYLEHLSLGTFRRKLASIDSTPQFALLGVASGLLTGIIVLAFRMLVEIPLDALLPNGPDDFEGLSSQEHFLLPVGGALALGLFLFLTKSSIGGVGVVHVLDRLSRHQGHLPARNLLIQFFTGIFALASGQSGGREGPAIHLGAAGSSLLGQALGLPNNSIRILVGCGAAAAISASFNTPIAGVIFSMEVIVMEYTIAGFIPVILSAVVAALVLRPFYGSIPAFDVPQVAMGSFLNLPIVLLQGVLIGCIAAGFIKLIELIFRYAPAQVGFRMIIAGTVTGLLAVLTPQILGVGYDTVNSVLIGDMSFLVLLAVCVFKILATATSIAMGMPIGLIGPTLIIGASAGGLLWMAVSLIFPELSSPAFYVMLGMGAMMGAVLQAPLAALMAIMELTHNPNIILPAMLVIIVANITAGQLFGMKSVFITQMESMGLEFRQNPLSMALNRASVASIMERNFARTQASIHIEKASELASGGSHWLLVDVNKAPAFILRTEDLATFLDSHQREDVDLAEIPATRKDVSSILLQATLGEAFDSLQSKGVQALYVNRITAPLMDSPVGIVTLEDIESYYRS
jgi:CIC family chloride channel protein|tara:strand:- start:3523 stop:5256 length:1734 start_codon:yes stop_codon:yes gene_type:complete